MYLIDLDGHFAQPKAILTIKPAKRWERVLPRQEDDVYDEEGCDYVPTIEILLAGNQMQIIKFGFGDEAGRDEKLAQIVAEIRAAS